MSELARLDENKGTLRTLITLSYDQTPTPRLNLISELRNVNVGKNAFYSSLETLEELGLVHSFNQVDEGKRFLMTCLTDKGYKIAKKLHEIQTILKED